MALQTQTKYRIVGALVLISLLVIFVPMFFEPPSDLPAPMRGERVPDNPHKDLFKSVEFNPQDFAKPPAAMALSEPVVNEEVNVESPASHEPEVVSSDPEPIPPSEKLGRQPATWLVQLGVFAQESNASSLRDKLRAQKYATFVDKTESADGLRWRMMVGPELSRDRAAAVRDALAKETGLHGVLVKRQ